MTTSAAVPYNMMPNPTSSRRLSKRSNSNTSKDNFTSSSSSAGPTTLLEVLRRQGPQMISDSLAVRPRHPADSSSTTDSFWTSPFAKTFQQHQQEPAMSSSCSNDHDSKPIRISPDTTWTQPRNRKSLPQPLKQPEPQEDDAMLSSSVELERFYDQATWRMYMLIQKSRMEQQERRRHQRAGSHIPAAPVGYHPQHSHLNQGTAYYQQQQQPWNFSAPSIALDDSEDEQEDDEAIFDMEL